MKNKIIRKTLCLLLIVFMTIDNKAAVVSDNDGSSFITKAEFDSLKNTFQSQIDSYNVSIDSKIDVAVSRYLAGISVSIEPSELWSPLMYATNNKFRWASFNLPTSTAKTSIVNNTVVNTTRYHNHPEVLAYTGYRAHGTVDPARPGVIYQVGPTKAEATSVSANLCGRSWVYASGTYVQEYTSWDNGYHGGLSSCGTTDRSNTFYNSSSVTTGSGKLWDFNILPNGKIELKKYNSSAYIDNTIEIIGYTYKNNTTAKNSWDSFRNIYCTAGGADYTTGITINIPKGTKYTGGTTGSIPTAQYTSTSNWNYGKQNIVWRKVDDGVDYSFYYFGTNTGQVAYGITNQSELDWASATQKTGYSNGTSTTDYHTYKRVYWPYSGDTTEDVKISNIKFTYYEPKVDPVYSSLNLIENQYVSDQVSEVVYHGEGAPVVKAESDDSNIKIKDITLKLYSVSDPSVLTSGNVRIMISKNKFSNGNFATASDELFDATVTIPSSGELTFSMEDSDAFVLDKRDDIAWINIYDTAGTGLVKLESINPVLVST